MIVKRLNLSAIDTGALNLGFVGENEHTQYRINCASVFTEYPNAVASMLVKSPSGVVYPKTITTDGTVIIWTVTESDTAEAGSGQIQLTFTESGAVVKTVIAATSVNDSLVGDNPPPEPIQTWIEEANTILEKVDGLTATAEALPTGSDPTATVSTVDGHYNIEFGIPGGSGGDPTEIIDDTAGAGDVTKVWSASKTYGEVSELKSAIDSKAPVILRDASGAIVTISDGADGMPLFACSVAVDPVQDLHGQSNPYPAGGAKNLIPLVVANLKSLNTKGTWNGNVYTESGVVYTVQEDSSGNVIGINANGTASANSFLTMMSNATVSDGSYILSGCPTGGSDTTFAQYVYTNNAVWDTGSGVTVSISTTFSVSIRVYNGATVSNKVFTPMLRSASVTDGTFAPYSNVCPITGWTGCNISRSGADTSDPTVYPISWQTAAGTVYGGTLDTVTGVLTVTHAGVTLDGSGWSWDSNNGVAWHIVDGGKITNATTQYNKCVPYCNMFIPASWAGRAANDGTVFMYYGQTRIAVKYSGITSAEDASALFGATNLQAVYELATPITYQLDPVQITALRESNIWADTGAISVTYPSDTRTYVDDAISAATDPDGNVVTVTGSTPSITGESGKRYVCGTVDSISITPPQTGIIDVVFTSGTTPTVMTVPSSVKFPAWFDATALDASTVYEINIQDGVYGAVMAWT